MTKDDLYCWYSKAFTMFLGGTQDALDMMYNDVGVLDPSSRMLAYAGIALGVDDAANEHGLRDRDTAWYNVHQVLNRDDDTDPSENQAS